MGDDQIKTCIGLPALHSKCAKSVPNTAVRSLSFGNTSCWTG
jgi:hypothetical protein